MRVKFIKTGKVLTIKPAFWEKLKARGKGHLYENLDEQPVEAKKTRKRKQYMEIENVLTKTEDGEI
jgi:hypothetical protein